MRAPASVPDGRAGGAGRGGRCGSARGWTQLQPRQEQVGVVAHDVAVGGIPPGPLVGDLGVGGARPEVASRDRPQSESPRRTVTRSWAAAAGRGCRRQQARAVGVVDRRRAGSGRSPGPRLASGADLRARAVRPGSGRAPAGPGVRDRSAGPTPGVWSGMQASDVAGRQRWRCRAGRRRRPAADAPVACARGDRTGPGDSTRAPAAGPASRRRRRGRGSATLRTATGVTRSATSRATRPAAPGSRAATASREPSASHAASSTPTQAEERGAATSSGRAVPAGSRPCRATVTSSGQRRDGDAEPDGAARPSSRARASARRYRATAPAVGRPVARAGRARRVTSPC